MSEKPFPGYKEIIKQYPALKDVDVDLMGVEVSQLGIQVELEKAEKGKEPSLISIALNVTTLIGSLDLINEEIERLFKKGKITKEEYEKLKETFDVRKASKYVREVLEKIEERSQSQLEEVS